MNKGKEALVMLVIQDPFQATLQLILLTGSSWENTIRKTLESELSSE